MFGSAVCTYSTGKPTRCVEALLGEKARSQFLIGTAALHGANHIHVVEYDSGANAAQLQHLYSHPGQVKHLAPSPFTKDLVFTVSKAQGEVAEATLFKMDAVDDGPVSNAGDETEAKPLTAAAELPTQAAAPSQIVWRNDGSENEATLASSHGNSVFVWKLTGSSPSQLDRIDSPSLDAVTALQWDPHHDQYVSFASGTSIQTWDTRSNATAFIIEDAHPQSVLDFDYNPNKPYTIASGGDDGRLKFWDLRRAHKPLLSLAAHSHWLQSVQYNRFHDQLVLSSSSDSTLALWRVSSISSAPIVELDEQDLMNEAAAGNDVVDSRIKSYEDHEDSVYSAAWGSADSWVFASVSYDGRVAMNQVPSTEKYKILL